MDVVCVVTPAFLAVRAGGKNAASEVGAGSDVYEFGISRWGALTVGVVAPADDIIICCAGAGVVGTGGYLSKVGGGGCVEELGDVGSAEVAGAAYGAIGV